MSDLRARGGWYDDLVAGQAVLPALEAAVRRLSARPELSTWTRTGHIASPDEPLP